MSEKLLPCPFCGGAAANDEKDGDERDGYALCVSIFCTECGVEVSAKGDQSAGGYADNTTVFERAIAAWNRRELESASQPGGGWQPIETAPKDGEVWAFNSEQGRMQWSEGSGWALWVWCDQLLSDADPEPEQPTHWMPLPAAPSAGNGGAEGSDADQA